MRMNIPLLNEQFERSLSSDCNGGKVSIQKNGPVYYIDLSNISDQYAKSVIYFLEGEKLEYIASDFYRCTLNLYAICFNVDQSTHQPSDFPIESVRHALILSELLYRFVDYFCSSKYRYILENKYDFEDVVYIERFYTNMKVYLTTLACDEQSVVHNIAFLLLEFHNYLPLNIACSDCHNILFCINCADCRDCELCVGCDACVGCYNNVYCVHNIDCTNATHSYNNSTSSDIYHCYFSENLQNCQYCFASSKSCDCSDLYTNIPYLLSTPAYYNYRCEKCKRRSHMKFRVTIKRQKSAPVVYIFCKACMLNELRLIRGELVDQYCK